MSFWNDLLKAAWPLLLKAAQSIVDSQVDGAEMNKDQRQIVYTAYVVGNVWGDDFVESTENTYDDEALNALMESCADLLLEAGVAVPVIPDELEP